MKLVQWLVLYNQVELLRINPGLPIHPHHDEILDILKKSGWIIDLDMKSGCGAWICLRGIFCGKGYSRATQDVDSILQTIGNSSLSYLEVSPSDSLDKFSTEDLLNLGFIEENNCGLQVMRWYKK
jgi:hypothetical protein